MLNLYVHDTKDILFLLSILIRFICRNKTQELQDDSQVLQHITMNVRGSVIKLHVQ